VYAPPMASPHVALVVNPRAGRGRVGRELPRLMALVQERGGHPEILLTTHPGHAVELARGAARAGADAIVAVGGDGTVNEVVNGMVVDDAPVGHASLGVVAAGSGCDFARTFGLPSHVDDDLAALDGPTRPLDVVRVESSGPDGPLTRYFVNVAEAGLGAATVQRADGYPRWMGRSRYVVAFWPSLASFRPVEVTITGETSSYRGRAHTAILTNARFFGGGMHIAPHSDPGDGRLDAQVNIGPKRQALTLIPKLFRGTHLPNPRIVQLSSPSFTVDTDRPIPVEADGEMAGETPARFTVLPGLLELSA
jgi:diacylglycerol kinase (ATP)